MNSKAIPRVVLGITPTGAEYVSNVEPFDSGGGQLQMHDEDNRWTLHLTGDTAHLRRLAGLILTAAEDIDALSPPDPRYVSPLGDRRERPVPCSGCYRQTFALDRRCDECAEAVAS